MEYQALTPEGLSGPLNERPKGTYVRGDISILQKHMSVSIIGSRKATEIGIKNEAEYLF